MAKKKKTELIPFDIDPKWIRVGVAVAIVLTCGIFIYQMEKVNRGVQIDRRLSMDHQLGTWYEQTKDRVATVVSQTGGKNAQGAALWYGVVTKRISSDPRRGSPRLYAVELEETELLAGKRGKRDKNPVYISLRGHRFNQPEPVVGDKWVFAVWRDDKGNNFAREAECYRTP